MGDVSVLINNAGIVSGKKFYDIPDNMAELTFKVNAIAHLWVSTGWGDSERDGWART